jgi:hypothetical protein
MKKRAVSKPSARKSPAQAAPRRESSAGPKATKDMQVVRILMLMAVLGVLALVGASFMQKPAVSPDFYQTSGQ